MKNKIIILLVVSIITTSAVYIYRSNNSANNLVEQPTAKITDSAYPWLNISKKYFSESGLQWSNSTQSAYKNIAVYQSYPNLETKIKNYENLSREMVNRTMEDIRKELNAKQVEVDNNTTTSKDVDLNPFDLWRNSGRIQVSYAKYGNLNMNYYPDKYIQSLDMYDVDDDGNKEMVVTINYTNSADSGSTSTDIIKNGKIVFSVNESQSSIVQAEINNGFYVEWRIPDDQSPHCCEAGFMRTRFVYEDQTFKPLYEQEVRYIKIGSSEQQ